MRLATINWTRILPEAIVNGYAMGESFDDFCEGFPSLSQEQVRRLVEYADDYQSHVSP